MSLIERLDGWRDPYIHDGPPSEEDVLRQFLYAAITDFVDQNWEVLHDILEGFDSEMVEQDWDASDRLADKWVDEYSKVVIQNHA